MHVSVCIILLLLLKKLVQLGYISEGFLCGSHQPITVIMYVSQCFHIILVLHIYCMQTHLHSVCRLWTCAEHYSLSCTAHGACCTLHSGFMQSYNRFQNHRSYIYMLLPDCKDGGRRKCSERRHGCVYAATI